MLKKTAKLIARSPWIPNRPTKKQLSFLALPDREAFYGGQVGGGKSDALLMAGLMYADVPGYDAIIFRRTYPELTQADGLIPRSKEWLGPTPARWNDQQKAWTFPSGATLRFGHMQYEDDKFNYQGGAYQYVGFDELTGFTEEQYKYLLSRLRRLRRSPAPLRQRGASNPGNVGHQWVYERFVVGEKPFVPASLNDNPHLSTEEYRENLEELDDITRAQLLQGLWVTDERTKPFKREWFDGPPTFSFAEAYGEEYEHLDEAIKGRNRYDAADRRLQNLVKYRWLSYDTAFKDKDQNDATGRVVFEMLPTYHVLVREASELKLTVPDIEAEIETDFVRWNRDGKLRGVIVEDKGSGIGILQSLARANPRIAPYLIPSDPKQDSKEFRARQASIWLKRDCMWLPAPGLAAPWLGDFEDAFFGFPNARRKDMVDAFTQFVLYSEPRIARGWRARSGFDAVRKAG